MKRVQAFTLFEVLIALTIFFLLAGGIFASVRAAFTASSQISASQLDAERQNAFQALMRKTFVELPGDAKVEMRLRKQNGRGDVIELFIWPAPDFLRFGPNSGDGVALSARPDGRGNFSLSMATYPATAQPDDRDRLLDRAKWMTLLPGVKEIKWRFAPVRNPVLSDTWNAGNGRLGLVELTLKMLNGDQSVSAYWVPPLQRRSSGGDIGEPAAPNNPSDNPNSNGGEEASDEAG